MHFHSKKVEGSGRVKGRPHKRNQWQSILPMIQSIFFSPAFINLLLYIKMDLIIKASPQTKDNFVLTQLFCDPGQSTERLLYRFPF